MATLVDTTAALDLNKDDAAELKRHGAGYHALRAPVRKSSQNYGAAG